MTFFFKKGDIVGVKSHTIIYSNGYVKQAILDAGNVFKIAYIAFDTNVFYTIRLECEALNNIYFDRDELEPLFILR